MTDDFTARFLTARRDYIESRFPHLNEMQRQAVLATEGPLLVLSGAGSGKTTLIINRIYNLLKYGSASDSDKLPYGANEAMLSALENREEPADEYAALDPVNPWQILAITFTNKAAAELKARLEKLLGPAADDIWACTFHSACVRILRRDADHLGFTPSFTIYDTTDSLSLLKSILKEQELDDKYFPPRSVLSEISRAKDARVLPEEYIRQAKLSSDLYRSKIGPVYKEYMHQLMLADAMDFDDLLLFTVTLLEENDDVRDYWQRRFRYVLIDEYQDTNMLQYYFSALVAGGRKNICVVGDDDQSIYKFRGATIENILSFEEQYPGCRTIRLEQNYRSTGHILGAANSVIRNNTERKGKELWTKKEDGDKIELYVADNENDEASFVASTILAGYSKGENWRDYAVLYRKNAQSNTLEYALKRNGIPYRIYGGTRFFDRAEVKDILSYMCVVSAPTDNLRLQRIINMPARGIGDKTVLTALSLADENDKSLFDVISHADLYEPLARSSTKLRLFANLINDFRSFAETHTPDVLFDEIVEKTGYIRALQEKNTPENAARIENVQELKSTILTYMKETGDMTLAGYLSNVALYTDLDNMDAENACITLMTMHSSKGLEFPHVFIVGMEETIFPGMQAIGDSADMEEERRLCYVAITRAMKTLHLVCAQQRMIFGRTSSNRVSRFVDEIPEEHISKNVPRGYGYHEPAYGYYRQRSESAYGSDYAPAERNADYSGYSSSYSSYGEHKAEEHSKAYSFRPDSKKTAAASASAAASFAVGDNVKHTAFGEGVVIKMTPMGNDYLIEINFAGVGSKKLMLRAASKYLEKI